MTVESTKGKRTLRKVEYVRGKKLRKILEGTRTSVPGSLRFFDDYFEGAGYGAGGTDNLTLETPATILCLNNVDKIINQHQGSTGANADAQSTAVTLFWFYYGHLSQRLSLRFLASSF